MNRLMRFWQNIRYSLWFVPTLLLAGCALLAAGAVELEAYLSADLLGRFPRTFGASAEGARSVLQVIASAMITVAGLTFSITVLVLSLGATQYTPRIIRTFMGNRPTQLVLGVFIGIFVYCLLVLRVVRGGEEPFVPSIAVALAIVLAFIGVGVLVFFIHHIASSIQASAIADSIARDTRAVIDKLYPTPLEENPEQDDCLQGEEERTWHAVPAQRSGYIQTVDIDVLIAFAERHRVVVKMDKPVGDFVTDGLPIALIDAPVTASMTRELNNGYIVDHYRTSRQDVGVGIRQLVDIALKAMSPAMNDTTTALLCIDYLAAILVVLAPRRVAPEHCFSAGALKVVRKGVGFDDFLRQAFEQIREQAQANTEVYLRLMRAYATVASVTRDDRRRSSIAAHARQTVDYARCRLHMADQLEHLEQGYRCMLLALREDNNQK